MRKARRVPCRWAAWPARGVGARADDQEATGALEARAQAHDVGRPGEASAGVWEKLYFDDDAEHGPAVAEEHDDVGVVLGGQSSAQRRRLDPDLGVRGQLETEGLLEQQRGELGAFLEKAHEDFMQLRGHVGGRSKMRDNARWVGQEVGIVGFWPALFGASPQRREAPLVKGWRGGGQSPGPVTI
ncbi:MAG: hypothetical protein JW940_34200 [Polyangiaceae bacterium]|nr:hypothetical protein [Polyangiaceae bacterium]